jgi:hypothetical protein
MDKPKLESLRLDGIGYSVEYRRGKWHEARLTIVWEDWGNGIFEPAVSLSFPWRYATESEIQSALMEYHATRSEFAKLTQRGRRALARFE